MTLRPNEQLPPESVDVAAPAQPVDSEMLLGEELCALLTHTMTVSKAHPSLVVIRVFSKGETAAHIGTTPERALRLAALFAHAAMHADPSLIAKFDETFATARGRKLRVVGDHAAEKAP